MPKLDPSLYTVAWLALLVIIVSLSGMPILDSLVRPLQGWTPTYPVQADPCFLA